jgi:branched-chain amino acid transport system substrate-binding protein
MKLTSGMRRLPAGRLIIAGSILALSACTSATHQPGAVSEVRIGLLGQFSDPGGGAGQEAARGAQLAAEIVNQTRSVPVPLAGAGLPGLGGAKIRIVQADTRGGLNQPATQATRLATQGVAGIVSVDSATSTALASERTERIGVPFMGAVATADFLTERGLDWFFRTTPTDTMLAQAGLGVLGQQQSAARRLGVVRANDDNSNEAVVALQGLAAQAGASVLPPGSGGSPAGAGFKSGSGADQVRPAIDRVRGGHPDTMIAVAANPGDARTLLSADVSAGGQRPVLLAMGPGFNVQTIRQAIGTAGTGLLHTTAWSQDFASRNPAASAVANLYQRRFNTPMTEAAAETFTATMTLAQAIDAARSVDAQRVRTALLSLDVPGRDTIMPWGGIRFDQTGENTLAAGLVEQVTATSARVVFPRELAPANT